MKYKSKKARFLRPAIAASFCGLAIHPAAGETDISTAVTTPIHTSTAANGSPDDVVITAAGSLSGTNVTLDSNNVVNNQGSITILDVNNSAAIVVTSPTGSITNVGAITNTDSVPNTAPPPFTGSGLRYGILVQGSAPFTGSITQTGAIAVLGNDSAAIYVVPGMNGALGLGGAITMTGDRSYGVRVDGPINGGVQLAGSIFAQGTGAVGASFSQGISGQLYVDNSIFATGYLDASRPTVAAGFDALTANSYLQGGSALVLQGGAGGGLLIDTGGLIATAGSAPTLVIGSGGGTAELHMVGTGASAYGLLNSGTVRADGVYDGFSATAIQIGGTAGKVTIDGGIDVAGSVTANAYAANATAISIGAGADVPALVNTGTTRASVQFGLASAAAIGGNATAVTDSSGTLTSVTNTGTIAANTPSGLGTSFDLRANTAGIAITQFAVAGAPAPSILGNILFGSGNAQLNVLGGSLNGDVVFGTGANSLTIDNGAAMAGAVLNAGKLDINVASGKLTATNPTVINATSLRVGATAQIDFTADPASNTATQFNVSGNTNVAAGAKIGLDFQSKLTAPVTYTLIQSGTLTGQAFALGDLPYFYTAALGANPAAGAVTVNVQRRSAAQAVIVGQGAYNAIFGAFDRDAQLYSAFNRATTSQAFGKVYEQMLPDYAGGMFQTLSNGVAAVVRAQADGPSTISPNRDGYWAEQIGFGATQGRDQAPGYRAGGVALAFGWETPSESLGTVGMSFTYMLANVGDRDAGPENPINGTSAMLGGYCGDSFKGVTADASVNAGYVGLNGGRELDASDAGGASFTRNADANWVGGLANAHVGLGYEIALDETYYLKPAASVDYFVLYEDSYSEAHGGTAYDLSYASRTGGQGSAQAGVTVGAKLGDDFVWRPELSVAYRGVFGGAANTVAQFSGGPSFTLSPQTLNGAGVDARATIRGGNKYSDLAFEVGGESRGEYHNFDGKLVARVHF